MLTRNQGLENQALEVQPWGGCIPEERMKDKVVHSAKNRPALFNAAPQLTKQNQTSCSQQAQASLRVTALCPLYRCTGLPLLVQVISVKSEGHRDVFCPFGCAFHSTLRSLFYFFFLSFLSCVIFSSNPSLIRV